MGEREAYAYAPATITNFFAIHHRRGSVQDFGRAGATGGGYIVSKGVVTRAVVAESRSGTSIETVVDGDRGYRAGTTTSAARLLLDRTKTRPVSVKLEQSMQVPVGHGFGASAASALSATFALASALDLRLTKEVVASFAHEAEIVQQTGLGTVSAAYDGAGAGVVFEPGAPGVARFMNVAVTEDIRIVTASLAPYAKSELFASREITERVNSLGTEALSRVLQDPSLECMASAGEWFSERLDLVTDDVRRLIAAAKAAGALHASQNMVGQAMHAVVPRDGVAEVVARLSSSDSRPRVDVFELGDRKAGVLEGGRA